jgi:hypothetical protein
MAAGAGELATPDSRTRVIARVSGARECTLPHCFSEPQGGRGRRMSSTVHRNRVNFAEDVRSLS